MFCVLYYSTQYTVSVCLYMSTSTGNSNSLLTGRNTYEAAILKLFVLRICVVLFTKVVAVVTVSCCAPNCSLENG